MKNITLNEEVVRIQEMMGISHKSPSGKMTNMSPKDDDYEINYGKDAIEETSPSDIVNSMREEDIEKNEYGMKEGMENNPLYNDIMDVIRNSNSSHEETLSILTHISDEMETSKSMRRDAESRFKMPGFGDSDPIGDLDKLSIRKNEGFDPSDMYEPGESDCCGAPIVMGDICTDCGEHCGTYEDEDDSMADGSDLPMGRINELEKELEEEASFMAMRAGKDGKVYEGRPGFKQETYFETQSAALTSAEEYAKHKGFSVNFESIKPEHVAYGQTVSYSVELMKDGVPTKKMLQISLYRMESGKYELTNYIN